MARREMASSSPTKLAESFAVGVPAICNYGVGDVESLMQELDSGLMVNEHSDDALSEAVKALPFVTAKGGKRLREAAFQRLGLENPNPLHLRCVWDALL